ncbi:hypothetical protein BUALT_Bualt01G0095300 [Buddleja alternifolia]|uniref:Reverse transcriptase domain-containing protein n=1 Tax=Buddleja alternifolia TaxID=168488 RepID=A0AAV6YBQ9_9LAMI|nr:hypothetical protein BUALT_Bualt01G0095300 [Buddleja alternifolia]
MVARALTAQISESFLRVEDSQRILSRLYKVALSHTGSELGFLRQTLTFFNLPELLIRLIMRCVTCSKPRILWKGKPLLTVSPSCGLRQGDPFSPYLFVLCMERLAHTIDEVVTNGAWEPVDICRGGPAFSHLFFADDLILMARATPQSVESVRSVFDAVCSSSVFCVNAGKSKAFFSRNLEIRTQRRLARTLGIEKAQNLGRYLGVLI